MCDPVTIGTIGTIASVASGVFGAVSSINQGKAANASAQYQAQVDEQNATLALQKKKVIDDQQSIDNRRLGEAKRHDIGELRAAAGAAGVDPGFGSSGDLIGDTTQAYRIDQGILLKNNDTARRDQDITAYNYTTDAQLKRQQGKDALKAGKNNALGSLLGSASAVAGKWSPKAAPSGSIYGPTPSGGVVYGV